MFGPETCAFPHKEPCTIDDTARDPDRWSLWNGGVPGLNLTSGLYPLSSRMTTLWCSRRRLVGNWPVQIYGCGESALSRTCGRVERRCLARFVACRERNTGSIELGMDVSLGICAHNLRIHADTHASHSPPAGSCWQQRHAIQIWILRIGMLATRR